VSSSAQEQRNENPGILPPTSTPYGHTYGEWAGAFWQWILSIPADRNPNLDTTGEFSGEGQTGPVWFLAGSFGDSYERTCRVPAGKAIFFPVYTWIFGAGVYDCEPSVPGVECDVDSLRAAAAEGTLGATDDQLTVFIDGELVENVRAYRAFTPEPFPLYLPEGNILGLPEGIYEPNVADSFSIMLAPLSKGEHIIQSGTGADAVVISHIIVE